MSCDVWKRGERVPVFWGLLLLVLFPFVLSEIASRLLFQNASLEARQRRKYHLETLFGQIETGRESGDFFTALFRQFEHRVFEHPESKNEWKRLLPRLKREFPGMIEGILFDEKGLTKPEFSDLQPPKQLSQRFFFGCLRLLEERRPLSSVELSFIKSYLGPAVSTEAQLHRRLILGRPLPNQHFIYISRPSRTGMFILFFRPSRPPHQLAFEYLTRRVNRINPDVRMTLVRAGESSKKVLATLGVGPSRRKKLGMPISFWKELQHSPRGHRWYQDTLVGRRIVAPSWWVIGVTTLVDTRQLRAFNAVFMVGLIVPLLVFLIFGDPSSLFRLHPLLGSIRFKLAAAILYTTLVPLGVMGITARSFLENRESVLRTRIHQSLEAALDEVDTSFSRYLDRIAHKLSWFNRTPDPRGKMTLERFVQEYDAIRAAYHLDSTQVFNASGVVIFERISSEFPGMFDNQSIMLGKATRDVLKGVNDPLGAINRSKDSADRSNEISLFSKLNLSMTSLIPVQTSGSRMFLNACYLVERDRASHVILHLWDQKKLKADYLRSLLPTFSRTYPGWHLLAWENGVVDRPFPADSRFVRPTRSLRRLVSSPSRALRHALRGSAQTWLMSGIRGKTLDDHSFLAVASDQPVQQELADLSWNLRFAVLLISGASLILGSFLARFFLHPISQLTHGMEAIMAGNFRYRLSEASSDELGLLSRHFNHAIANLRELEVARTLQEQLFPDAELVQHSWGLFGNCQTASQVGGDYVDYSVLPGGEWRFILGDVSGHGVGSSLVVAMAKAIMEHPDTPSEPGEILTQVNATFHAILKRKKMMSAVVGFFQPKTGSLRLTNAGQCYPILVRNQAATFIEMKGLPLGTTKTWKPTPAQVQLQAGDAVIFYSDGLYESADRSGEPIGFDRLLEALPTLVSEQPATTVHAIREWHARLSPLSPPADDITILVLQWMPNADEQGKTV